MLVFWNVTPCGNKTLPPSLGLKTSHGVTTQKTNIDIVNDLISNNLNRRSSVLQQDKLPNIVVELRIREAPGSTLGPEISYPEFSWFYSVPLGRFWDNTLKLGHDRFLPDPFQFIIRLSPFNLTLYSLS
jgi:hypothetical protein